MKQHVIVQAPLQGELLATLRADEGLGLVDHLVSSELLHREERLPAMFAAPSGFLLLDQTPCFSYDTQPGLLEAFGSGGVEWVTVSRTFWFLLTQTRTVNCFIFASVAD